MMDSAGNIHVFPSIAFAARTIGWDRWNLGAYINGNGGPKRRLTFKGWRILSVESEKCAKLTDPTK